jgi:hypothetical protein
MVQPCVDFRGSECADGMGSQVRCKLCAGSEKEAGADRRKHERGAGGYVKCVYGSETVVCGGARNGKKEGITA